MTTRKTNYDADELRGFIDTEGFSGYERDLSESSATIQSENDPDQIVGALEDIQATLKYFTTEVNSLLRKVRKVKK